MTEPAVPALAHIPTYRVLARGREMVAITPSWSWPAFLLPWAWPLLKRLWWPGAALGASYLAAHALHLVHQGAETLCGVVAVEVATRLVAGIRTNRWLLRDLRRQGWVELLTVRAISAEDALITARLRTDPEGNDGWRVWR